MDGKPYPVHNGATIARMISTNTPTNLARSYRRIDAKTMEYTQYADGVAGNTTARVIAKDGKSFTETTKGKDAKGISFSNVLVFERVR